METRQAAPARSSQRSAPGRDTSRLRRSRTPRRHPSDRRAAPGDRSPGVLAGCGDRGTRNKRREDDRNSRERLAAVEKELAQVKEQSNALKVRWKQEKEAIARVREMKEKLEQLKLEIQDATRKGDYNRDAQLQYGELR